MFQRSASLINRLAPPNEVNTEPEEYLAQSAAARKISLFDLAIAIVILLDFVLTYVDSVTKWCQQYPDLRNKARHRVRAALNQSSFPSVPAAFQHVIEPGHVRESMRAGACPHWTSE
jgi:hypothetical protein